MILDKKTMREYNGSVAHTTLSRVERPQLTFFLRHTKIDPIYKAIIDENKQKTGCKDLHLKA